MPPRDLRTALELQRILTDRFRDPEGGFFFTPDDGEELLTRLKEGHDGAVPSGNAVTLMNLIRLGRMTGDPRLEEEAAALSRAFAESVRRLPSAHAQWLIALEMLAAPSCEVVIAGRPEAMDTRELIDVVRRRRFPRPVLLLRPEGEDGTGNRGARAVHAGDEGDRRPGRRLRLQRLFLQTAGDRSAGTGGNPCRGRE